MDLETVLKSPELTLYGEERSRHERKPVIINPPRHREIVDLAERIGVFDLFRRQPMTSNSANLWFFHRLYKFTGNSADLELYETYVNDFQWSTDDVKYGLPDAHLLKLYEYTRNPIYLDQIRKSIQDGFSYNPSEEEVAQELLDDRRMDLMHEVISKKVDPEKAREEVFRVPNQEEIEKTKKRMIQFRLSHTLDNASGLFAITESQEDLSSAIRAYNLMDEDNDWLTMDNSLILLLRTTKRSSIRDEFIRKVLVESKKDFFVGSSFSGLVDLFSMTRLPEDRSLTDSILDRGIELLRRGVSTNFGNYIDRLMELYAMTRDESYLERYASLPIDSDDEQSQPFLRDAVFALPLFKGSGNPRYIPRLELYCKHLEQENMFRIAEDIYFTIFQKTKDPKYFRRAREMFVRAQEEVSEEKPILSLEDISEALSKTLCAQSQVEDILNGEEGDIPTLRMPQSRMSEYEVAARIGYEIDTLLKYLKVDLNPEDVEEVRRKISLQDEIQRGSMCLRNLFDLYQLTGSSLELDVIERKFREYIPEEHELFEHDNLLEEIVYEDF